MRAKLRASGESTGVLRLVSWCSPECGWASDRGIAFGGMRTSGDRILTAYAGACRACDESGELLVAARLG